MMAQMVWQKETRKYTDRISALKLMSEELRHELSKFPGLLSFHPTDAGSVRHRTLIFANGNLATSTRLIESIQLLWRNSHFHAAAHCIRLLFELWGSLIYAREKIIRKLEEKDGAKTADKRVTKLTLGSKSQILLPAGIEEHFPVINVMDFIRAGNEVEPGFEDTYIFLCDVSHPSFVIHTDLFWLTNDGSWANDLYAKEAHRILERITATAEGSVAGIELQSRSIYQGCIPPLVAEIEENS